MFWTLLKIRMRSVFFGKNGKEKGNKKGIMVFVCICLAYAAVCLMGFAVSVFSTLAKQLVGTDDEWLYFGIAGIAIFLLGFISIVFAAKSQIFEAKDNELLLSMPVPVKYIITTRIATLLVLDGVEAIILGALVGGIFMYYAGFSITIMLMLILEIICLIALTAAMSTIVGWLFAVITAKMRNKSAFTTAVSLALMGGYFYFINKANTAFVMISENIDKISAFVKKYFTLFYYFGNSLIQSNVIHLILFCGISLLIFMLTVYMVSVNFVKIATTKASFKRKKYNSDSIKVRSVMSTFISKEIKRFLTSAAYMVNAGFGLFIMVIGGVVLIIKGGQLNALVTSDPFFSKQMGMITILIICAINLMNIVSAPSISIEGKTIWIGQSLPVKPQTILMAKVWAHVYICMPFTLFLAAVVNFVFDISALARVMVFVIPLATNVFTGFLGVITNLWMPKLDWVDETIAVKQSLSVLVAMAMEVGVSVLVIVAYMLVCSLPYSEIIMSGILLVIFIIPSILIYNYFGKKGADRYKKLSV